MVDFIINVKAQSRSGVLWRHPDFLKLWAGQTISEIGSRITRDGIPLTAVLVLGAQPYQMSFLSVAGAAPLLLLGLLVGAWVDRLRRRPIMIAADVARAVVLASIPYAAFTHRLSMPQLYVVIAAAGVCTVFFDVAYQTYLPSLVERNNLLEGNSKLAMSGAAAEIAGPSMTGVLVQTITAPIAILFDAVSFVVSAVSVGLIRKPEPAPRPEADAAHPIAGLHFIFGHSLLRPIACYSITAYFFFGFLGPLYTLFSIRELRVTPAQLGFAIAMGGVGSLIGSALAPGLRLRFGLGRMLIGAMLGTVSAYALIPLARGPAPLPLIYLIVSQIFGDFFNTNYVINEITLRQRSAPAEALGRVNAAMQLMTRGVYPIGCLIGGFIAQSAGARTTIWMSIAGFLSASIWLIASPLRSWKAADDAL